MLKMSSLGLFFLRGIHGLNSCVHREMAPFISILIIVGCLLSLVFCKMEVRRMGYSVLRLAHAERQTRDRERLKLVQLAKITRPERLQSLAENRLTLRRPGAGQIIQMTEQGVAFRE